jgi:Domain of unknown function (DUF4168)
MNNAASRSVLSFKSPLARAAQALALTALSGFSLAAMVLMPLDGALQGNVAMAQEEPAFTRYVRAAYDIEKQRRQLMSQVKQMTGGNVPKDVCQSGLAQLPDNVRTSVQGNCNNFTGFAGTTVKKYNLRSDEFNKFQQQSRDPNFQKQINDEIRRLNLK